MERRKSRPGKFHIRGIFTGKVIAQSPCGVEFVERNPGRLL
jgi:hypothetical protein